MPDIIITPSTGKLEFINNSAQNIRKHAFSMDDDGLSLDAPLAATSIKAPLNIINVNVDNSNTNYPFVLASGSAVTGIKTLMMDGAGGTYNPFTNIATIDISGNSATTTLASDSTNLGGVVAASYVTLTGTQTLTNKTITGTFTGNLTGTGSWATNAVSAVSATTATNSTQLNGQAASYYTNIPARLGYTPVNQAGDTIAGNLTVNGNFTVNGSVTAFSASNIYLSSSVITVEDNILTLNAFSPYLRYAGIEMYDSGSGTLSQLLWDGDGDYFFLTGSSVNGKIITGPDGQTNLTANYIPKATAGYKLGNSLIYDDGTNVGIGTTSPSSPLTVQSNGTQLRLQTTNEPAAYFANIGARYDSSHPFTIEVSNGAATATEYFGIYADAGGANNRIALLNSNVGIGTSSPAVMLHVQKSQNSETTVIINNTNSGAAAAARLDLQSHANNYLTLQAYGQNFSGNVCGIAGAKLNTILDNALTANSTGLLIGTVSTNPMYFVTANSVKMLLSASGNLGIGTTSPAYKLDVNGTIALSGFPFAYKSGNYNILVEPAGTNALYLGNATDPTNYYDNTTHYIRNRGGGSTYVTINSSGNVGIGTTNPVSKLEVSGSVTATSFTGSLSGSITSALTASYLTPANSYTVTNLNASATGSFGMVGIGTTSPAARLQLGTLASVSTATPETLNLGGTFSNSAGSNIKLRVYDEGTAIGGMSVSSGQMEVTTWSAGKIAFYRGTTQTAIIDANGNLGIGTTSPAKKLDVNGDAVFGSAATRLTTYSDSGYSGIFNGANLGSAESIYMGVGALFFIGGGIERVRIASTGNVGIGTTTPTQKLEVAGYVMAGESSYRTSIYGNSGGAWIGFGDTSNTISLGRIGAYGSLFNINSINGDTSFQYNGSEKMRITTGGNVGIGTPIPTARLDVRPNTPIAAYQGTVPYQTTTAAILSPVMAAASTDTYTSILQLVSVRQALVAGRYAHGYLGFSTVDNSNINGILDAGRISIKNDDGIGSLSATSMGFWTNTGGNASGSATERVRIASDGNVGVGTTSPGTLLNVHGATPFVRINTTATADHGIKISYGNSDTHGLHLLYNANSALSYIDNTYPVNAGFVYGDIYFRQNVAGTMTTRMTIKADGGNVGIGTTSPGNKLEVKGADDAAITAIFQSTAGGNAAYNGGIQLGNAASSQNSQIYHNSSGDNTLTFVSNYGSGTGNKFIFSPGGTERVRFQQNGNVGIGTTSPTATLQVGTHSIGDAGNGDNSANVRIGGSSAAGRVYNLTLANTATATNNNESALSFIVAGNYSATSVISAVLRSTVNAATDLVFINYNGSLQERMRIQYDGNVGIGSTSPLSTLNLSGGGPTILTLGTTAYPSTYLTTLGVDSSARGFLILGNNGENQIRAGRTTTGGYIDFYTNNTVAQTTLASDGNFVMRLAANGNVGIGTTTGTFTLNVYNNADVWHAKFGGATGEVRIGGQTSSGAVIQSFVPGSGTVRDLYLQRDGGNIGVGLNNPSSKIHIYENANRVTYITQNNNHTARFEAYGTATAIDTTASNGIFFRISGGDIVKFAADGNVGIGTTSPEAKLHALVVPATNATVDDVLKLTSKFPSVSNAASAVVGSGPAIVFSGGIGDNQTRNRARIVAVYEGSNVSGLAFHTQNTADTITEKVRFQNNGNVGIGTTNPTYKLQIGTVGSLADSIRIGTYQVAKNTRQYIGYARDDSGLFESAGNGDTPSTVLGGVSGIRIVNTQGTSYAPQADNSVQLLTHIYNNGSRVALHANYDGNVGIGTTSPATLLHVDTAGADARIRVSAGSNTVQGGMIANTNGLVYAGSITNHGFSLRTNDTDRVRIQTDGNVGIGTTGPGAKLQINNASDSRLIVYETGTSPYTATLELSSQVLGTYGATVQYTSNAETLTIQNYGRSSASTTQGGILFRTKLNNTTATDVMVINGFSGNVGIGTTGPVALLNIRASVPTGTGTVTTGTNVLIDSNTSNYITFRNTADNGTYAGLVFLDNNVGGYITFRNYTASGVAVGSDCMIYGSYQDHIFQSGVSETINGKTETMRIQQNGYVGINTNNPTARLHVVQGNSGGVAAILLSSDESTIQGPSANTQIRMGSNLVLNASSVMLFNVNGSETMRIITNGSIGIGTTTPGKKLDVEGVVRTRGATGTGGFEIGAATTGTAKWRIEWDSASDSLDFNWVG